MGVIELQIKSTGQLEHGVADHEIGGHESHAREPDIGDGPVIRIIEPVRFHLAFHPGHIRGIKIRAGIEQPVRPG